MEIKLDIINADLESLGPYDFLTLGHKNPLIPEILAETGQEPIIKKHEGWYPHEWKLVKTKDFKWKNVGIITYKPKPRISEVQYSRISDTLIYGLNFLNCRTYALLPPSWRYPRHTATIMILAIWTFGYAALIGHTKKLFVNAPKATFNIISKDTLDPILEVLDNDLKIMWEFLEKLCLKNSDNYFFPKYKDLREKELNINWNVGKPNKSL